jgi:hypothetical protein
MVVPKMLQRFVRSTKTTGNAARCEWSIGIYVGRSPLDLFPPENVENPVLTWRDVADVKAGFVADPFMISFEDTWHMFFEVKNRETQKGEIGLAISKDGMRWSYRQIVLAEPFHLSYPYVFRWMDNYYMLPESSQAGSVRLYRAQNFPTEWLFVNNLLTGDRYVDSTIFRLDDRWWLLTGLGTPPNHAEILRLYYAETLLGGWTEHPASPIFSGNGCGARPAGRALVLEGRVIRYAQDCHPFYGSQVRAFEITDLTPTRYEERAIDGDPILTGSGSGWNGSGMHHLDPHRLADGSWMACVDGWRSVPI